MDFKTIITISIIVIGTTGCIAWYWQSIKNKLEFLIASQSNRIDSKWARILLAIFNFAILLINTK